MRSLLLLTGGTLGLLGTLDLVLSALDFLESLTASLSLDDKFLLKTEKDS